MVTLIVRSSASKLTLTSPTPSLPWYAASHACASEVGIRAAGEVAAEAGRRASDGWMAAAARVAPGVPWPT